MKRKLGFFFVAAGMLLMLAASALLLYNRRESRNAFLSSQSALSAMQADAASTAPPAENPYLDHVNPYDQVAAEIAAQMKEVEINGELYIGYLTIPILKLELPVISEWSYERLQIAPCRQFGSTKTDDLVIAAHNYDSHFGKLSQLRQGDLLTFSDMDSDVILYEVAAVDILEPTAVKAVKNSDFDLVLYTCTYGGENRIVVFCNRAKA